MNATEQTLTAYADSFSGVSGDMFLGALIDAGLELAELQAELGKLDLEEEIIPIIDVAVNCEPSKACPGRTPMIVSGIGAMMISGTT